jgi:hypothetical protein
MKSAIAAAGLLVVLVSTGSGPSTSSGQGVSVSSGQVDERGVLAVLRRDGLMLPFAAFNGDDWTITWPADLRQRELPVNTEAVPDHWWGGRRPEAWQAWLTDGTDQPLAVQKPFVFPTYCGTRLGLRTNYIPTEPMPPVAARPFPKDGLGVSGGVRVAPIDVVDKTSPEWTALVTELAKEFDRIEDREVSGAGVNAGWRHPLRPTQRKAIPIRLESWYRMPIDDTGGTASWIEAVRSYPVRPEDEGCGLETFFSGWIVRQKAGAKPRAQLGARLMYCDRVGANYMLPFGKMRLKNAWFWIYQLSGYDNEWYAVAEISRSRVRVVAEYLAGSCF